jgi:diacylglycerol kinase
VSSDHERGTEPGAPASSERQVLRTPDGEELDQSVIGTLKIDPTRHRTLVNPNRLTSLKYAVAGLLYVLVREQSIQYASLVTLAVIVIGLWLQIPVFYWAFLTLALGGIWITECINTAIEAAIDLSAPEPHPLAKIGKDVASAATLVATIVFIIIVVLTLGPRIIDRLNNFTG